MNRNYEALELNTVLDMLANETTCEDARELALALNPTTDLNEAKMLL